MTYYNPVQHFGHARFAASLVASGIDGAIIPDLPARRAGRRARQRRPEPPWADAADEAGVETVLLAALTTPEDRLAAICERSRGFVYGVSLLGVTGERAKLSDGALEMGRRLKAATDKPVLLGVGLSTPEQAVEASSVADGVIVGSALVRRLLEGGGPEQAGALMAEFRQGLDGAGRAG